jgi:hypothetical protein
MSPNPDLLRNLQQKTNSQLFVMVLDDGTSYTQDAREAASQILLSRRPEFRNISILKEVMLSELNSLLEQCSICQNPEVVAAVPFKLEGEREVDFEASIPGIVTTAILGFGFMKTNAPVISLQLKLCAKCAEERILRKSKGLRIRITEDDCYSHPLYDFYEAKGLRTVRLEGGPEYT